jgi:integrase-like protein
LRTWPLAPQGSIPDGGGWRAHGRDSAEARAVGRTKERGTRTGYIYLHSAIDGHTRLAYTEALENEQAATAIAFLGRAREWFAKHGITKIERIITDNGACYRAQAFAAALDGSQHRRTKPYTPKHNGKVERYNRILAEEFLSARTWNSETERVNALATWNQPRTGAARATGFGWRVGRRVPARRRGRPVPPPADHGRRPTRTQLRDQSGRYVRTSAGAAPYRKRTTWSSAPRPSRPNHVPEPPGLVDIRRR